MAVIRVLIAAVAWRRRRNDIPIMQLMALAVVAVLAVLTVLWEPYVPLH